MNTTLTIPGLYESFRALQPGELILDVRTPEEFAEGHVPGSRNIPHDEVGARAAELKAFQRVFVYCRSGGRVGFACGELSRLGLENLAAVVDGGMPDWVANGYPVER